MKFKQLSLSCVLALAGLMTANAGTIDANAARQAANNFVKKNMAAKGMFKAPAMADIKLAHAEASSVEGNAYYVFNIQGGGWVIIAGDDRAKQVLAYGENGNIDMNEMPASMKGQLNTYKQQIEAMQNFKGEVVPMKAPKRVTPVAPLTKSTWGQNEPMDRFTPMYNTTKHYAVGCAPLAMAQIMYYWKYPEGSKAMSSYYAYGGCGTVPALDATTFDYNLMLDAYTIYNPETGGVSLGTYTTEEAEAVAKLCRYAGHACKARYGNSGSSTGAYSYDQLDAFKFFGYSDDAKLIGYDPSSYCDNYVPGGGGKYTEEAWKALISVELEAGRPIAYHNVDFVDGHAWVLDGVDADGKFHMNWGFYERFNGYFEFGAFGFYPYGDSEYWDFSCSNSASNEMIINLIPYKGYVIPGDEPQVKIGDVNGDGEVSIADVSRLIDYLLDSTSTTIVMENSYIDADDEISIGDVSALIDMLLSATN